MIRKLGFQEEWIRLIMMCVMTVSYSVLINEEPKGKIISTRGLRQGDPIFPYLFLLCAEGLTAMLRRDEREGLISGISVCRERRRYPISCSPMTVSSLVKQVVRRETGF